MIEPAGQVLIVTGPPGSGKTSVARLLATKSRRAVHVEADEFFHMIRSGYVEPWKPESDPQNAVVMTAVGDVAATFATAEYFTIVEGVIVPGWYYEPLLARLGGEDIAVGTVILRPDLGVCLSRARQRSGRPLTDRAVIENLWRDFENLGPLEGLVLDTAVGGAATFADVIWRGITGEG